MKEIIKLNTKINFFNKTKEDLLSFRNEKVKIKLQIQDESTSSSNIIVSRSNNKINVNDYNYLININIYLNYDVVKNEHAPKVIITDLTGFIPNLCISKDHNIYTQFPIFFSDPDIIKIPKKIVTVIDRFIPKKRLKEIDNDLLVARELCLLFVNQLNSTYFEVTDGTNPDGWKSLKAKHLRELLSLDPSLYLKVINAVTMPTKKGAIVECDNSYIPGKKNKYYRLGDNYIAKGFFNYSLQTDEAKNLLKKYRAKCIMDAQQNVICRNLIKFYDSITLPTTEEIISHADILIKANYKNKKGKILAKLNKQSKRKYKNSGNYYFVEDGLKVFEYLTSNGIMIPRAGSDASGGRVVDSFTLMPSWIRQLIKIDGKPYFECDYCCFHPNIAMLLYEGSMVNIKHDELEEKAGLKEGIVKVEHLSFFNKEVWQMKKSPLYSYYKENEPEMLRAIENEKFFSEYKHKITSRKLFSKEVLIMKEVIEILNKEGIYVGYVYDALFCNSDNVDFIRKIMNNIVNLHGVKTVAK